MKLVRCLVTVCLTLLCGLAVCAHAAESPEYKFVREFGQAGNESNQFLSIDDVAVDSIGRVFVTDLLSSPQEEAAGAVTAGTRAPAQPPKGKVCVKRWSVGGEFQLFWTSHVTAVERPAAGIDCAPNGDPFYVAPWYYMDPYGSAIAHTDPSGNLYAHFPTAWFSNTLGHYMRDVAISADGHAYAILYAATPSLAAPPAVTPYVVRYDWNGSSWINTAADEVTPTPNVGGTPWSLAVDTLRRLVYITILKDAGGPAGVQLYDLNLNYQGSYSPVTYDAQPLGIAIDGRDGSVFVCDAVSNLVYKYDTNGVLLTSWGGAGSAPSEFNRPSGIAVDMNGWVYVADADNHRVQVFAPPGESSVNFIVDKATAVVRWRPRLRGKTNDTIAVRGLAAIDSHTNITTLAGQIFSFHFGNVPIIPSMLPTKVNRKGNRAIFRPDKNHAMTVVFRQQGAFVKLNGMIKRADIPAALGIVDDAVLPPWLWVQAEMTLADYTGVHHMRLLHKNKVGKVYKAWKK